MCKLFDEIEEHKKSIAEMKAKIGAADKSSYEIQNLKDKLEREERHRESAQRLSDDYKKQLSEQKEKIKALND